MRQAEERERSRGHEVHLPLVGVVARSGSEADEALGKGLPPKPGCRPERLLQLRIVAAHPALQPLRAQRDHRLVDLCLGACARDMADLIVRASVMCVCVCVYVSVWLACPYACHFGLDKCQALSSVRDVQKARLQSSKARLRSSTKR